MKNNETDEDKKVDDVSIKKGILSETNDTKKTKNDFKLLKFFIIILIVFVLSICINFIRNHLIIQKLAKNIDDLDQNYRLNIVDLSDEEIFNYNTYYKDGNFIEHINYILLSNSNNDFEIKQVINKGYIKDNLFYFKEFLLKENTYSENQSHYVSNIKLSDILTIENYKKLEDSEYIKKCLKIIFIPTKIDGVDCYEIKDVFNSNYRIYIDKNTGLNYKTIFDSTSQETENVSTIRTYEIIPEIVTDEDFQIENEEQFIKRN